MIGQSDVDVPELARDFGLPPRGVRPKIYLFPPNVEAIDGNELEREIEQIAAAGFGSVNPFDPDLAPTAGQNDLLRSVLRTARRLGIGVDLTMLRFAELPDVEAGGGADQQELVYGTARVAAGAGFDGPPPEPLAETAMPPALVASVAARPLPGDDPAKPVLLDRESLLDLTDSLVDGRLAWTAPAGDGEWLVFGVWRRTAETPWTERPYFDYFSPEGTAVFTEYWDRHVFTEEIQALVDEVGDTLFEDSLHLEAYQLWTPRFLSEFERRRGYSLRRYLPIVFIPHLNDWFANTFQAPQTRSPGAPADFDFTGDVGGRIRNDYYRTLSELYEEHHLETLTRWARSHGLQYRAKVAYHHTLDISAAASVDVPNTESFAMGNTMDGIRAMAGPAHLGRKPRLVVESAPTATQVGHDLYSTTWPQALSVIHTSFAGGANELELHAFAYAEGPDAVWSRETHGEVPDTLWPGFWPYRGARRPEHRGPLGFGEALGPRMPYWAHMPDITKFLAREQLVLRQGKARIDLAVYRHSFWSHGFPYLVSHRGEARLRWFGDQALERRGYTYDFVGASLLERPNAMVAGGRLDPDGPAYKALILDAHAQADGVHGMPLATARRIVRYASDGLPVVVVGDLPDRTGFYGDAGDDPELRATLASLLAEPGVRRVATERQVVDALAELGVEPDFDPTASSNVVSVHRATETADLYLLYNRAGVDNMTGAPEPSPEAFEGVVSLAGGGVPYLLDAWTGEIHRAGTYVREGGGLSLPVRLGPGDTTLVALARDREAGADAPHATATTAVAVVVGRDGELRVRAGAAGSYSTSLSDGTTVRSVIDELPAVLTASSWELSVEDWQPGAWVTETVKRRLALELDTLAPWPDIPELRDVSGVGRYTTELTLDASWVRSGLRVELDLGSVFGSVRVAVNGKPLRPINCHAPRADVTEHLREGRNAIEVELATTLRNRLRTLAAYPEYRSVERQPYGLLGPVRLVPYAEAPIGAAAARGRPPRP